MSDRQIFSLDEIRKMLLERVDEVVHRYAPPSEDSWTHRGQYFTTNPGRADRHAGSFSVTMRGPKAGKWRDYAVGDVPGQGYGDVLDLIALAQRCSLSDALREARAFLGLETLSPEDAARIREKAERAAELRKMAAAKEKDNARRRRNAAWRIFLSGQERLRGTPVDLYLRGRGIDLVELGRQPRSIRYVPKCRYYRVDQKTGEVFEGEYPAMVAAMVDRRGRFVACHRTYLALNERGRWGKLQTVPKARLVLGDYSGAAINVWRGLGPRGGKPPSLPKCPPGTHVYIAEGIEDALSAVLLLRGEARVIAASSLGNLGSVYLPDNVASVTLVADLDLNEVARAQLRRAIHTHQQAGRTVRVWQNRWGGKDLNDALQAARTIHRGNVA